MLVGGYIGKSLLGEGLITELGNHIPVRDGITELLWGVFPLCSSQMLQFALLFIFGLTVFAHPVNCLIFGVRGACLGYCTCCLLSTDTLSVAAVSFALSYALVTAVMLLFAVNLTDERLRLKSSQSVRQGVFPLLNGFILLLMTSGVCVLIRIFPVLIWGN